MKTVIFQRLAGFAVGGLLLLGAMAASAKTLVLGIGLNSVDPSRYNNWSGVLATCEADVGFYLSLYQGQPNVQAKKLLTGQATVKAVKEEIATLAAAAQNGDIVLIFYSGHGSQVFDANGDEKSNSQFDNLDETWCLFDRQLVDDELYDLWTKFAEGVSIIVVSDSCRSGSVTKAAAELGMSAFKDTMKAQRLWNAASAESAGEKSAEKAGEKRSQKAAAKEMTVSDLKTLDSSELRSGAKGEAELFKRSFGVEEKKLKIAAFPLVDEASIDETMIKGMPYLDAITLAGQDKAYYDGAQAGLKGENEIVVSGALKARVLLLAASGDDQVALAPRGWPLSLFTYYVADELSRNVDLTHRQLLNAVAAQIYARQWQSIQLPVLYHFGLNADALVDRKAFR